MRALLVVMLVACVFAFVLLGRNMSRQVRVQPLPVLEDGMHMPPPKPHPTAPPIYIEGATYGTHNSHLRQRKCSRRQRARPSKT
jgi:hypothetical protein